MEGCCSKTGVDTGFLFISTALEIIASLHQLAFCNRRTFSGFFEK